MVYPSRKAVLQNFFSTYSVHMYSLDGRGLESVKPKCFHLVIGTNLNALCELICEVRVITFEA